MNQSSDEKMEGLLKTAIPPLEAPELQHDLWPRMLQRLDQQAVRLPWWDWALVAAAVIWCFFFPQAITGLIYHL